MILDNQFDLLDAGTVTLGLVIGLVLGVALARLMESALFGIVAVDPWLFAAITTVRALAALAGTPAPRSVPLAPIAAEMIEASSS